MPAPEPVRRRVCRVTQSPMNAVIWFVDLECRHEVRMVQKQRPAMSTTFKDKATGELMSGPRMVACPTCAEFSR